MGTFKSSKTFYAPVSLIPDIANEICSVFQGEGYEIQSDPLIGGSYDISIAKGGAFKKVLGLSSALKVNIQPQGNSILIEAGVGIFGKQAVPLVVMWFVGWPLLITNIWGLVQQSKLDDKVMDIATNYIASKQSNSNFQPNNSGTSGKFCSSCGKPQPVDANFCNDCGARL